MLVGVLGFLCYASCTPEKKEKEVEAKLSVTKPLKMDTCIVNQYVCQIKAIRHIELRALERGYIEKIYIDEGQMVKQGQMLFQIMPRIYQAELQKAEAEVNFAEIEYQNTQVLTDKNVVSKNELALAKAKLDKAKAEVALTKAHLQFTEVRAPFDGIIDRFQVRQGSLVAEGDLLTTLSDNSKMWVYFNVPEAEYLDYKSKADTNNHVATLLMANNKMFDYPGVVETIEADFDNQTGNIPFRATFPNPKGLLRHGETGNIRLNSPIKNALLIPQKATFEILDKKYVYVVGNDNRVMSKEITISADMEDVYVVSSGLSETDKILLEGLRKVKDNDVIAYEYKDPKTLLGKLKVHAE
ncbi:MAG: efflux RND transporter periplasmic adaptor subunit [Chitinophagia bacterium]|nr:efflux RND transporter periplasmic adaptor subunit [Chitinophagia bacterium]